MKAQIKPEYTAPEVEILTVAVEKSFANSGTGLTPIVSPWDGVFDSGDAE